MRDVNRESDLAFGVLAVRMGRVPRILLVDAVCAWLNEADAATVGVAQGRSLADILRENAGLSEETVEEICAARDALLDAGGRVSPDALRLEPSLRETLLGLEPPGWMSSWLRGTGTAPETELSAPARGERYEVGAEIARGGLGRVVEGFDRDLRREVALKLLLEGHAPDQERRFVREALVAARLEHPAVVPTYDFGEIRDPGGGRKLFLCMKRIRGRTLDDVIRSLRKGEGVAAARLSRARLLAILQDVCLGMAYAHAKGVIHRDLKPANVMVGEFGEVLIVDWGLAKSGGLDDPVPEARVVPAGTDSADSVLTLDGDVLGTPAFMSPEQAAGRTEQVDARSDVFSLGAILYCLLTWRSPMEGLGGDQALDAARQGRFTPPARRVEELRAAAEGPVPEPVSATLEAICLRAMALRPEDRFRSALELHDELQLYLEGVKERERNHRLAEEAIARALEALERRSRLDEEARSAAAASRELEKSVQPHEDKSALWAAQDRARSLERGAVDALSEANGHLASALTHESGHAEARRLSAELSWQRFLEAEETGDEKGVRLNRAVVERYNDGPFDALLAGDGTLTVRTRAYPCRCLADGRRTLPGELAWMGYHPWSGRELSGMKGAEGLPGLEPREPLLLRVHGPDCEPVEVEGADVWLFRHEEIERRLFPVTPALPGASGIAPDAAAAIAATFEPGSPYRPRGPGVWLGRTPIRRRVLPMGSYLLLVAGTGSAPLRVPVRIPRCAAWEQELTLYRPEEIPAGTIPISAGPFWYQGTPGDPYVGRAETMTVDDFFLARHPITCREYCEFLNELGTSRPDEAAARVPRNAETTGHCWPAVGGTWHVPTAAWLATAAPEARAKAARLHDNPAPWQEVWPVFGVSWEDLVAYCAWRSRREGRVVTLPHEVAWEKSARGTDRRTYVCGTHEDPRWMRIMRSDPAGPGPVTIGEYPADESPYGVRGLGGNSRDACLNSPGEEYPGWRVTRGGDWSATGFLSRTTYRSGHASRFVLWYCGGRVAVPVRCARAGRVPDERDR